MFLNDTLDITDVIRLYKESEQYGESQDFRVVHKFKFQSLQKQHNKL